MIKATKSQYLKVARELKKKILNTPGEYKAYLNKRVVSDKQVYYTLFIFDSSGKFYFLVGDLGSEEGNLFDWREEFVGLNNLLIHFTGTISTLSKVKVDIPMLASWIEAYYILEAYSLNDKSGYYSSLQKQIKYNFISFLKEANNER